MDDSTPKYLNSPETIIFNKRKNLFALNLAKKSKLGYLILVEGYMDAVALHQYGFDCAVASLGTSLTQEHAVLLSRYTEQVVLIYDGDEAGQNATRRAIPMLEAAGIQVKVLRMHDAKDPDEYLKKYGADKFKILLEEASNRVEYQMGAIARKYHLNDDEERIQFLREAADLVASLPSPVQREIYGGRAAETAKVTPEAMKLEVDRARKRREKREKKQEEQKMLSPAQNMQPKSRTIRYEDIRSAMAEEVILANVFKQPSLLDQVGSLTAAQFSCPLLGRIFRQQQDRYKQGLEVSASVLDGLESDEMAHLAGILQRNQGPVNEQAFADCVRTVLESDRARNTVTEQDLLALRDKMKEKKGMKL